MSDAPRILPAQLAQMVEMYIDSELDDERKYDNRTPLDESGVFSLHRLAASIYAQGWEDGERSQAERDRGQRQRAAARSGSLKEDGQ